MLRRRAIFASLVVGSAGAALGVLAMVLGGDGLGIADTLMLLSFALTLPWAMIGFWNAVIGFLLQFRYGSDTARIVCPPAAIPAGSTAPTAGTGGRTAILMLVHEEDPDRFQIGRAHV